MWYVLRKGRSFKVRSCRQHFWKVVGSADFRPLAQRLMFQKVGEALKLTH